MSNATEGNAYPNDETCYPQFTKDIADLIFAKVEILYGRNKRRNCGNPKKISEYRQVNQRVVTAKSESHMRSHKIEVIWTA